MAAICGRPAPHNGHLWKVGDVDWSCSGTEAGHPLRAVPLDMVKAGDNVNHPPHYTWGPVEVIEITERLNFCLGNVIKYVLRADHKGNPIEDLKKARFYIDREIQRREKA